MARQRVFGRCNGARFSRHFRGYGAGSLFRRVFPAVCSVLFLSFLPCVSAQSLSEGQRNESDRYDTSALVAKVAAALGRSRASRAISFSSFSWANSVDEDNDNYTRERDLRFSQSGSGTVFYYVVAIPTGADHDDTDNWISVFLNSASYESAGTKSLNGVNEGGELSRGTYDFIVTAFDSSNNLEAIYQWDADPDLANERFETASQDTPEPEVELTNFQWDDSVDEDGDGYTRSRALHFNLSESGSFAYRVEALPTSQSHAAGNWISVFVSNAVQQNAGMTRLNGIGQQPELAHDSYDFRVSVLDSSQNFLVGYGLQDSAALGNEDFETADQDTSEPEPELSNFRWNEAADEDGDGYSRCRDLQFDLSIGGTFSYYIVAIPTGADHDDTDTWITVFTSAAVYQSAGRKNLNEVCGNVELTHGTYDFIVSLLNSSEEVIGVYPWSHQAELAGQRFETIAQDSLQMAPVVPIGPYGTQGADNPRPVFRWNSVSGAEWYHLTIRKDGVEYFDHWLQDTQFVPYWDLAGGDYTWTVQAWGAAAGLGDWCDPMSFSIPSGPRPGGLTPSGDTVLFQNQVTLGWNPQSGASWYQVVVRKGTEVRFDQWFQATTVAHWDLLLDSGDYNWTVRSWGASSGMSDWSATATFSVSPVVSAPLEPILTEPSGVISGDSPVFRWSGITEDTQWNWIVIERDGQAYFDYWVCTTTEWPTWWSFDSGTYTWYVIGWNRYHEFGPWSAPATFKVY